MGRGKEVLDGAGLLRVPRAVELLGLDFRSLTEERLAREEVARVEKALA